MLTVLSFAAGAQAVQSDEERLLEYLFDEYNPSARPVINSSKTVGVQLQFSLMHIQELVSHVVCYQCIFIFWVSSMLLMSG